MELANITLSYSYEDAPQATSVFAAALRTRLGWRPGTTDATGPPTGDVGGEELASFAAAGTTGSFASATNTGRAASRIFETSSSFSTSVASIATSWRPTLVSKEQALARSSGGRDLPFGDKIYEVIISRAVAVMGPSLAREVLVLASDIGGERVAEAGISGPRADINAAMTWGTMAVSVRGYQRRGDHVRPGG